VENLYNRVENLDELIRSVKLPYLAWKVLFTVNKDILSEQIAELAEAEQAKVDDALRILVEKGLILVAQPEASIEQDTAEPLDVPEEIPAVEPVVEEDENLSELLSEVEEETSDLTDLGDEPEVEVTEVEKQIEEPEFELEPESELKPEPMDAQAVEDDINMENDAPSELTFEDESSEKIIIDIPEDDESEAFNIDTDANDDISDSLDLDINMTGTAEAPSVPDDTPETATDKSGFKTILVIDDSLVIRKMVEIALDEEDFNIETAVSGNEGLEMLDKVGPDLVILDMMLPDINGMEILKTIKASKGIPVIMLSGKDSPQLIETAKNEGAEAFLPKPFKDDDLVDKIKSLI